jgi:flagellin-like hook-associated protein FlgL
MAEDIDQTTQTFATSANDAVAQASGLITGASDKDTIDNAIKYLQDVLSYDANTFKTAGEGVGDITGMSDGNLFLDISIAGDTKKAEFSTTGTVGSDQMLDKAIASATGIGTTYNGELFAKAVEAFNAFNTIVDKMGDSSTGIAKLLLGQLKSEFTDTNWDGKLGNIYDYKDRIYANGTPQLIDYYEQYTSAAAEKNEALVNLKAAVKDYNEGVAQLDALKRLQALETEKLGYQSAVDSFVNALRTEMKAAQEGTYTLKEGSAGNAKAISFDAGNSNLTDSARSEAVESIVSALKDKLYELADNAMLNIDTLSDTGFSGTVIALIGQSKTAAATNGITYAVTGSTSTDEGSAVLGVDKKGEKLAAGSSFLEDIVKKADAMKDKAGALSGDGSRKYLDLAQNDVLAQFSGPAIVTGSTVGLDPAGKKVSTLDGTSGLTFMAATAGTQGQISGFSISISDSEGNVRKSVNTSLNAWKTTIFAKNASEKDNSLVFHVGASANQSITVDMADMRAEALGLKGKDGKVVDVSTKDNANAAISVFDTALQKALDVQTTIGAIEARLTYTSDNLTTASENLTAAESTIRDADMAKAMTEYTKNNVLLQAAQSMLAQANQNSSAVLSLLQ